ncbi:Transcriptional regulator calD [Cladobotryum mycophilum]|uniref:Transcriptional regulator calD n=1 Tax=Cladobotryum mycophilum TaxID=491253 RepID=A0ABR0SQ07_9HYPO
MVTSRSGDRVVPMFISDTSPFISDILVRCGLAFNDILDAEKLRQSLETLLKREGWNKLGGRLKSNGNGGVDYHIPADYTAESPPIEYLHAEYDMKMGDHPVASRLPRLAPQANLQPLMLDGYDDLVDLFSHDIKDRKLNFWLDKDRPLLSLYVTSFRDGTLVSLIWPHAVLDLMGLNSVVDAWLLVLQGRDAEIATPYGGSDPFVPFMQSAKELHVLADTLIQSFGFIFLVLRLMFNTFWGSAQRRIICVPAPFVKRLRDSALKDLDSDANTYKPPFLSDSDLVTAWLTRTEVSVSPPNVKNMVAVMNAHSERDALTEAGLLPKGTPYLSNAIGSLITLVNEQDILNNSIGHLASWIRRSIIEQSTVGQVQAFMTTWLTSKTKYYPFFGHWRMHMSVLTNWSKANWYEKNFSAAAKQQPLESDQQVSPVLPGRPFYVQCNNLPPYVTDSMSVIVGKDMLGNFWINIRLPKTKCARMERLLAKTRLETASPDLVKNKNE